MPRLSGPQVASTTHVLRTQTTNCVKGCPVVVHSPLPGFSDSELALVQQSNQTVPLVILRLGHEGYGDPGFPLGRFAFTWYRRPSWWKSVPRVTAVRPSPSRPNESGEWPTRRAASNSETALV